jgi:hypothetical protein
MIILSVIISKVVLEFALEHLCLKAFGIYTITARSVVILMSIILSWQELATNLAQAISKKGFFGLTSATLSSTQLLLNKPHTFLSQLIINL